MRRAWLRRLLAVALALLVAVAFAASSSAVRKPAPKPRKVPAVSAVLPYVAPWDTGFKRYSTQIVKATKTGTNVFDLSVPAGQWWRVIYSLSDWLVDATVADRYLNLEVIQANAIVFSVGAPVVQKASQEFVYVFAPNAQAFSALPAGRAGYAQAPLPDMLWGPGTKFSTIMFGMVGLDTNQGGVTFAIEVYTVEKDGAITPVVPTPLIP